MPEPKELDVREKDGKLTLEGRVVDAVHVGRPFPVVVRRSDFEYPIDFAYGRDKGDAFKNAFEQRYELPKDADAFVKSEQDAYMSESEAFVFAVQAYKIPPQRKP